MNTEKIENIIHFYVLASTLKDKIRRGWKIWHIEREPEGKNTAAG